MDFDMATLLVLFMQALNGVNEKLAKRVVERQEIKIEIEEDWLKNVGILNSYSKLVSD